MNERLSKAFRGMSALALTFGMTTVVSPGPAWATGVRSHVTIHPVYRANQVTLRYMLWDPNEEVGYKRSIAQFEKIYPNIHVQIEQYPWAQYWQKLQTEMAAGDAPDLFWDHVLYFPTFAASGQLLNLSPMISQSHLKLNMYYPQLVKQYQYNGGIYGLPKDWDTIAFFYNKDLFKKLHITYPSNLRWNPQDGGSFLKLAQRLTVDRNGRHPNQSGFDANHVVRYGLMSYNSNQGFYFNFIAMNGGRIMDHNFGHKMLFNSRQSSSAMRFLIDLIYKYHVSPTGSEGIVPNGGNNAQQFFQEGKIAMYSDGDWNLTPNFQGAKFHIGIGLLPTGPSGRVSVMNGLSDAIYAHTQHPREAWLLEKWLASPQSERILAQGGYVWPGIPSAAPMFAQAWARRGVDVSPFLAESTGRTISFPITTNWAQAGADIDQELNLLWLNKVSAQEAVNAAVAKANTDLAQQ